ncbi:hypothetical protein M758_12G061900 [Ceratodon purpureus]|nr:hypothetical protein M758_12G061900 [Ceratodon purpureus]
MKIVMIANTSWKQNTRFSLVTVELKKTLWSNYVWIWKDVIDTRSLTSVVIAYLLERSFRN